MGLWNQERTLHMLLQRLKNSGHGSKITKQKHGMWDVQ